MVDAHDCQLQTRRSGPDAMHACNFAYKQQQLSSMQKRMKQTSGCDKFTTNMFLLYTSPCLCCSPLSVFAAHLPLSAKLSSQAIGFATAVPGARLPHFHQPLFCCHIMQKPLSQAVDFMTAVLSSPPSCTLALLLLSRKSL